MCSAPGVGRKRQDSHGYEDARELRACGREVVQGLAAEADSQQPGQKFWAVHSALCAQGATALKGGQAAPAHAPVPGPTTNAARAMAPATKTWLPMDCTVLARCWELQAHPGYWGGASQACSSQAARGKLTHSSNASQRPPTTTP